MTTKFGWCFGPEGARTDHESCPAEIGMDAGIVSCSCPCHGEGSRA